ncbi:hypothetical protein [Mesorhizobium sp. URHB0026]
MGHHRDWPFGYIDQLLSFGNLLIGLLVVVFLSMNPPAKKNPDTLPPPGNIAVLMCWAPGPTDVDLWLGAPGDKSVGYSRKSGTVWALLRDDMGIVNDVSPINCESAFARATPAGEYVVNIHGYSLPETATIHIEVSLNGSLLVSTNLDLKPRQERTVVRFTLDGKGMIVPGTQSQVYQPLRSAQ